MNALRYLTATSCDPLQSSGWEAWPKTFQYHTETGCDVAPFIPAAPLPEYGLLLFGLMAVLGLAGPFFYVLIAEYIDTR